MASDLDGSSELMGVMRVEVGVGVVGVKLVGG